MKLRNTLTSLVILLGAAAATSCGGAKQQEGAPAPASASTPPITNTSGTNSTTPNGNGAAAQVLSGPGLAPGASPTAPGSVVTTQNPAATQGSGLSTLINSIAAIIKGSTGAGGGSATASGSPAVTPMNAASSNLDDLRQNCLSVINQYRASIGRPALTLRTSSSSCLDGQAAADAASGFAHSAFGKCGESAQDVCPGWDGSPASSQPGCLKMMWDEGPGGGHYENMSNADYKEVACGFAPVGNGYWMTQDFYR